MASKKRVCDCAEYDVSATAPTFKADAIAAPVADVAEQTIIDNVDGFSIYSRPRGIKKSEQQRVRERVSRALLSAGIDYCLYGRAVAMKYGVPLVGLDGWFVQIAVADDQMESARNAVLAKFKQCTVTDGSNGSSRWSSAKGQSHASTCTTTSTAGTMPEGIFFVLNNVNVELLPAFQHCRYPSGTFDRIVATSRKTSSRLPSLPDCLVALVRSTIEPDQQGMGAVFATMLVDVYFLGTDWLTSNVSNLDRIAGDYLLKAVTKQKAAFRKNAPTGWILYKFFTRGDPLPGPLYQAATKELQRGQALPQLAGVVVDWPPPKRPDWGLEQPLEAGNICSRHTSASNVDDVPNPGATGDTKGGKLHDETPSQWEEHCVNKGDCGDSGDKHPEQNNSVVDGNKEDSGVEKYNDDEEEDSDEDYSDAENDVANELLLETAQKCVQIMQENQGGAFAFVGGFAFQLLGMPRRATSDIDFACQKLGQAKKALESDPNIHFSSKLASGAFLAHFHTQDNSGDFVKVPINGLQAGEFGPRRIVPNVCTNVNGLPVLMWTELLRMKIKSYVAREGAKDKLDILYCLEHHSTEVDTGRLLDVVEDNFDALPAEIRSRLVELFGYDFA